MDIKNIVDTPKFRKAIVENKVQLSWKVFEVTFKNIDPVEMNFAPGQFVNLIPSEGVYRAYSIASDFREKNKFSLVIEIAHEGVGANFVKSLNIGDEISFVGPSGRFRLRQPLPHNLFFYATGTGVAPFMSMFYALAEMKYVGSVNLFFGNRTDKEVFYLDKLNLLSKEMANFNFKMYISAPDAATEYNKGRITQELANISKNDVQYYICGHPKMVDEVNETLISVGVTPEQIILEGFTRASA